MSKTYQIEPQRGPLMNGNVRMRWYINQTHARLALSRVSFDRRGDKCKIAPVNSSVNLWRVDDVVDDPEAVMEAAKPKRIF